jgi:hypothetical protein
MGTECLTRLYLKHPLPDSPAHSATAGRFVAPWWRWVFIIKKYRLSSDTHQIICYNHLPDSTLAGDFSTAKIFSAYEK